jgi:hypothetical protein
MSPKGPRGKGLLEHDGNFKRWNLIGGFRSEGGEPLKGGGVMFKGIVVPYHFSLSFASWP